MNTLLSIFLVASVVSIVFLVMVVVLVWILSRLSFREFPTTSPETDQPRLPEWASRVLTAIWPIELIFACVLAPSIAVVVINDSNLLRLIGIAVLVGAFAYLLGFVSSKIGWWLIFADADASGCGNELAQLAFLFMLLGALLVLYYALVAALCRHFILPGVFRVAGISTARIPLVLKRKSDRDGKPDRVIATHSRATADLDQTAQLNPNDAKGYHNRGFAYYQQGDLDRAIADYDRAIELQPDNARVYLVRGLAYQQEGQRDQAIADYGKALELSRDPRGRAIAKKALQELKANRS
jgi:tetratricopeptide (TPR) repeat protein